MAHELGEVQSVDNKCRRCLLVLMTFREDVEVVDYLPPNSSSKNNPISTPYSIEAIVRSLGLDQHDVFDSIAVISTKEHCEKIFEGENAEVREMLMTWTGSSSLSSERVKKIEVDFSEFDIMQLWKDINKYLKSSAAPPDEIVADLSGLGALHTTALSRILNIYSLNRRLDTEANHSGVTLKAFSTVLNRDSEKDKNQQGWIIDQSALDPIENFHLGVYEFTQHADPEPLISIIKMLSIDKKRKVDVGRFIKVIREFSDRLREGLPFSSENVLNEQTSKQLNSFKAAVGDLESELAEVVGKALNLIRGLLQVEYTHELSLDENELMRLVNFAEQLVIQGSLSHALRIYREVIYCRIILQEGSSAVCQNGNWLSKENRRKAESLFRFRRGNPMVDSPLKSEFPENSMLLDELIDDRNHVAHSGFNLKTDKMGKLTTKYLKKKSELRSLFLDESEFWEEIVKCEVSGHFLLTPLGESPGVLTTLLETMNDDTKDHGPPLDGVVIITSQRGFSGIEKAIEASSYSKREGFQVISCILDSSGEDIFVEPLRIKTDELKSEGEGASIMKVLLESSKITINYTGGLSSMGILIDRIAQELEEAVGREVTKVICVDRRSPAEKAESPLVIGQVEKINRNEVRS